MAIRKPETLWFEYGEYNYSQIIVHFKITPLCVNFCFDFNYELKSKFFFVLNRNILFKLNKQT